MSITLDSEIGFIVGLYRSPALIDDFDIPQIAFNPNCRPYYRAILDLRRENKPIELTTVIERAMTISGNPMVGSTWVEWVETYGYISQGATREAGAAILENYKKVQLSVMARVLSECLENDEISFSEAASDFERGLTELTSSDARPEFEWMHETISRVGTAILNKKPSVESVIETRVAGLNKIIAGFEPGDYVVIASPPSYGKTAFASDCCYYNSLFGVRSLYFNFDQTNESLARRVLMAHSGFTKSQLIQRDAPLSDYHKGKLTEAINEAKKHKGGVLQADSRKSDIASIERITRRAYRQHGVGMVVIDYLQQVRWVGRPIGRTNEITEISGRIKALGIELGIPILVLSQLSREYDKEPINQKRDKWPRPRLTMLRDTGAIEQDANIVLFIYSKLKAVESKYGTESDTYRAALDKFKRGVCIDCEIIVAKNKDGETGTANCQFNTQKLHFSTPDIYHVESPML